MGNSKWVELHETKLYFFNLFIILDKLNGTDRSKKLQGTTLSGSATWNEYHKCGNIIFMITKNRKWQSLITERSLWFGVCWQWKCFCGSNSVRETKTALINELDEGWSCDTQTRAYAGMPSGPSLIVSSFLPTVQNRKSEESEIWLPLGFLHFFWYFENLSYKSGYFTFSWHSCYIFIYLFGNINIYILI